MYSDLAFTDGALRELGNSVISKSEDFGELLNGIQSSNSELMDAWQGTNASKYAEKVAEQAVVMTKLQQAIAEVGQQLIAIEEILLNTESNTTLQ